MTFATGAVVSDPGAATDAWLGSQRDALMGFLDDLIAAPSPNPPADCRAVLARVAEEMQRLGLDTELRNLARGAESAGVLLGWLGRRSRNPVLLMNAHVDTSPPGDGWTMDPYEATHRAGHVYGRGAVLSKGDVAAYVYAAGAVAATRGTPRATAVVAITADEGSGGHLGPAQLVGRVRPDAAICAGMTHQVTVAHNGCLQIKLSLTGRPVHTALVEPTNDIMRNVLALTSRALAADDELRRRDGGIPGIASPTLSITRIAGGEWFGMAPGVVEVWLDRRVTPFEDFDRAHDELLALVRAVEADTGTRIEVEYAQQARPLETSAAQGGIAMLVQSEAQAVLGEPIALRGLPLYTDARWFGAAGIPTVMYGAGPSDIRRAGINGADERVSEDDVHTTARVLARVIGRAVAEAPNEQDNDLSGADAPVTRRTA
jgi:acetylornithine deacetylase/succinyl-diaminopimelate desuccinylase-like protein